MATTKGRSAVADKGDLAAVAPMLQGAIDRGELAGVVTATWHRGQLVQQLALGWGDREAEVAMQPDSIFRVASMTKPVTAAAALMLVDEGRLKLDDPIDRWLPELGNLSVLRDPVGPLADTVPAERPITVDDLLTHRAGFAYGFSCSGPIGDAYNERLGDITRANTSPDAWLDALGSLPLIHQPGTQLLYGVSDDVLGFLVARIEGASFGDVLQHRVLDPLGMTDTGFHVPTSKQSRVAAMYDRDGARVVLPAIDRPPPFAAGGSGLFSTAADYLAFARMLHGDGTLNGVRLLRPETARAMHRNALTPAQRRIDFMGQPMWHGMGFGLGLATIEDPAASLILYGRPGAYGWPGAYGTWWQVDPDEDLIMIYLVQDYVPLYGDTAQTSAALAASATAPARQLLPVFRRLTYAALTDRPVGHWSDAPSPAI